MAEYINKEDIAKLINDSFFDLGVSDDRTNMLTEVDELPTITLDHIADIGKKDLVSRQDVTDALDRRFAEHIKQFDYDSYEKADEKTQLVCDGIIDAIDVVLGLPSALPEIKPIDYQDCANAMMKMWIDNVVTDGEYNRIMGKLNAHWGMENE